METIGNGAEGGAGELRPWDSTAGWLKPSPHGREVRRRARRTTWLAHVGSAGVGVRKGTGVHEEAREAAEGDGADRDG